MPRIHVFTDESRTRAERYMLIGGIWIPAEAELGLRNGIDTVRRDQHMSREFKWTKVSNSKLPAYKAFVDQFFTARVASFNCIVVNVTRLDHAKYSKGDSELGFYKFYFQLLSRRARLDHDYIVRTDHRTNREADRLPELRRCSNGWCNQRAQRPANPFRSIEARNSKDDDLIQLADVILGAVGYACNGWKTSPAKLELARHICQRAAMTSLAEASPPWESKFNSWHWEPSQKEKRPSS